MIVRYGVISIITFAMTLAVSVLVGPLPALQLLACALLAANTAVIAAAMVMFLEQPS